MNVEKYQISNLRPYELTGRKLALIAYLLSYFPFLRKKMARESGWFLLRGIDKMEDSPAGLAIHPYYSSSSKKTEPSLTPIKLNTEHKSNSPYLSFWNYHNAYVSLEVTPTQVAEKLLQTIERHNKEMCWIRFLDKNILKQAEESTERYKYGSPLSQLDGVFVSVKESLNIQGLESMMGTNFINKGVPAQFDSTIVSRLRQAGAIVIGSSVMDELGWNVFNVNPYTGTPINPFKLSHSCGGSSGGGGGIVSAGIVPVSIGTDAGGSIRIPSSFCGLYGLKTTYARISSYGGAKIDPSVNSYGPLAATADDMALTYSIISGPDVNDTNTLFQPPVSLKDYNKYHDLSDLIIGVIPEWNKGTVEPAILESLENSKSQLIQLGARFVEVELGEVILYKTALLISASSEINNYACQYKEKEGEYLSHTRIFMQICTLLDMTDYYKAQQLRRKAMDQLHNIFKNKKIDLLMTPTTAIVSPKIPKETLSYGISDMKRMGQSIEFTTLANLTGVPAVSVPFGYHQGLPIGIQFISSWFNEALLLRIAKACECLPENERRRPDEHWFSNDLL